MGKKMDEKVYNLRHSTAHLLAQAVLELYPDTKLTLGPVTETGFFYDFKSLRSFKKEDLLAIEKKMRELAKKDLKIEGKKISPRKARELFKDNPFKLEIIDEIEAKDKKGKFFLEEPEIENDIIPRADAHTLDLGINKIIGIYSQGDFFDLCKGGHVKSTGEIKHFKLTAVSGSYWRADQSKDALQRIYGVVFETKEELDKYLKRVEEAKLYDHRRLGKQLDLFSFHEEASGFPFFHDKGLKIYNSLIAYSRKMHKGLYQEVKTPFVMSESLWRTSGHYDNYEDKMYFTKTVKDEEVNCVRPMNCPGGILIYKEKLHSYRELPLRITENGFVHRFELSGVLHGLFRVRGFTIDDAHIYCTEDQIEEEVVGVLDLAKKMYEKFGFTKVKIELSTRPEKFIGSDELWKTATSALKNALEKRKISYDLQEGGGAFYGPKIDMVVEDAMGREWQCGTVQLDFFLPQNFKLEYITSDQSRKTPIIIHRAIYGSIERFLGILLEHYKGRLPFWLAPVQVRVLMITDSQHDYAKKICDKFCDNCIEVELDESGDQISAKIRRAQIDKVPWIFVVGKKEQENETITLRHGEDGKQEFGLKLEDLIKQAKELIKA